MPQIYKCSKCGYVLERIEEVQRAGREPGAPVNLKYPDEVIEENNGFCPRCGRKLQFDPDKPNIDIIAAK